MRRALVAVAIVLALAAAMSGGALYQGARRVWGAVDSTQILFRNAADLEAFQAILADETAVRGILSLLRPMDLSRLERRTDDAQGAARCEGGEPRSIFTFVFADHEGRNTRTFRVDFSTCKRAGGGYAVQLEGQRFSSDYSRPATPVAVGEIGFRALVEAIRHGALPQALGEAMNQWPVADVRVLRVDAGGTLGRMQFQVEARAWKSVDGSTEPERCGATVIWYDSATDTLTAN